MGLKDTIEHLAKRFAAKRHIVEVDEVEMRRQRIKEEKARYEKFTETTLLAALDELNAIEGLHVTRLYTTTGNNYAVVFDFVPNKKLRTLFSITADKLHPIKMIATYVYDMGGKGEKKAEFPLTVNDDVEKIISIFEQGIARCGPRS